MQNPLDWHLNVLYSQVNVNINWSNEKKKVDTILVTFVDFYSYRSIT